MVKRHHYDNLCDWVLDSGATSHMSYDRSSIEELRKLPKPKKVLLRNDMPVGAYVIGTIRLAPELVLQRVLYVPALTTMLCSVRELSREGYEVLFRGDECVIPHKGYEIARAKGEDLYILEE